MENKKINKLMIPYVKKTLSLLGAVTIMTTSMIGCSDKDKKKNNSSDISTTTSNYTSMDETSSEITITGNSSGSITINSNGNIVSNNILSNNSQTSNVSSNNTSSNNIINNNQSNNKPQNNNQNSNNTTTNNTQSNNTNSNNTQSNNNQTNTSTIKPQQMPSTLTSSNINNVEVFKHFANEFNRQSFTSSTIFFYGYYYNDQQYITSGEKEFQLFLAMLNYDSLDSSTLKHFFGDADLTTLKRYASFDKVIDDLIEEKNIKYSFDKFVVDKQLATYLNKLQDEFVKLVKDQDNTYKQMALDYFINSHGTYYYGNTNPCVDNFVYQLTFSMFNYDFSVKLHDKIIAIRKEVSNNYNNLVLDIYNNINSKSKILN